MTAASLNNRTAKDLADMARKKGVPGWHSMRKDQLVTALVRSARSAKRAADRKTAKATVASRRSASANGRSNHRTMSKATTPKSSLSNGAAAHGVNAKSRANATSGTNGKNRKPVETPKPKDPRVVHRLQQVKAKLGRWKNLAFESGNGTPTVRDRLVVMVRDAYWLHAYWELTRQGVERAEAAMGQDWHTCKPVLRVYEVTGGGTTTAAERLWRDIEIHGGVCNWYIDVIDPPKSYRLDIGYLATNGRFYALCRSNTVSTPPPGTSDAIDKNWADVAENFEKVYALSGGYSPDGPNLELQQLFEERLRRPMGSPMSTRFGSGADALSPRTKDFEFELDAELIVYGSTEPDAHVTLQGDPVRLRPDGSFTVRFSLPNCRQVIPAVACSANGLEQRTIVLAVERNTKTMEPLVRDGSE